VTVSTKHYVHIARLCVVCIKTKAKLIQNKQALRQQMQSVYNYQPSMMNPCNMLHHSKRVANKVDAQ